MPATTTAQVVYTPSEIRRIQLPDGWHSINEVELIEFVLEESKTSSPHRTYAALQYKDPTKPAGNPMVTPLSQVLSFEFSV